VLTSFTKLLRSAWCGGEVLGMILSLGLSHCIRVRVECRQIQVPTPIPRVGASRRKECPLFNSAGAYSGGRRRRVGEDSLSQTVYRNDFLVLVPTLGIGDGN
jgi:hypothetical protein